MTINTRQDFLDQFDAINQIINSNHKFISNGPNPSKKRSAMRQINTEKGYEIEKIRVKLSNGENVTEDEVATLRKELSQYYASRHRNNVAARFFLNFLPAVITGPVFHAFYWIIDIIVVAVAVKANKKSTTTKSSSVGLYESTSSVDELSSNKSAKFRWDWTKAIPSIGNSFSTLKDIKSFLDDTEELDVSILNVKKIGEKGYLNLENSVDKEESKKAKRRAKSKAQKKQSPKPAAKFNFVPTIVDANTLEAEVELKPLQKLEKQDISNLYSFEPVIIDPKTIEGEVSLKPLEEIQGSAKEATLQDTAKRMLESAKLYVEPAVSAFTNFTAPKVNPVQGAVKPELSLVTVSNVNAGPIMKYRSPQSNINAQSIPNFLDKLKATGQKLWAGLSNPTNLFTDTLANFIQLKKQAAPVKPLAIANAEPLAKPSNAVEQVVFVEHTYAGTINGNELVDLKLFVTICGENQSTEAFLYKVDGSLLGQYASADVIRMVYPSLQIDVDFDRKLLTDKASASDDECEEEFVEEEGRVIVLADDVQEKLAVVVAEPTTPTKAVTRWERFIAGVSEVVETVKNKLSPQKQVSTQATPNADANLLSPNNLTGLPVERVRMDDADVNYANEAVNNPSYVVDMDKLDDDSSSVAILKALSPVGVVVLDDSGHVVRQAGDVVVALDFGNSGEVSDDLDPFAPFLHGNSMTSTAYTQVFQSETGTTGNPFVEEVTVEANKDDLSLQMDDDAQSTDPEIF